MLAYEYRHSVTFEDTSAVGNVYYVNHLRWQGRCRELFLREHAGEVFSRLGHGLCMVTTRCGCEYLAELAPNDDVIVRMRLLEVVRNRITMGFEYFRVNGGEEEELVARGEQEIATMHREGDQLVPQPIPAALMTALAPYCER